MAGAPGGRTYAVVARDDLQALIDALAGRGYQVVGPTVRDGAIIYDDVARLQDLPVGWTERQEAGRYHLEHRDDEALFGFAVGPQSWKRFLHPPVISMWTARKGDDGGIAIDQSDDPPKYAFIGVRACELSAIAVQDKVFRDGPYPDVTYEARRRDAFIVAVNCGEAGGTCFCVSMQTGPKAEAASIWR